MRFPSAVRLAALPLSAATVLWTPANLAAQGCLGSPALYSQAALDLTFSFPGGATGYGVGFTTRAGEAIVANANVTAVDVDNLKENLYRLSATAGYELDVPQLSICPAAGVEYATFVLRVVDLRMSVSQISFPIGVGVGKRFELRGGLVLVPSAMANLIFMREQSSLRFAGERTTQTATGTRLGGVVGTTFGYSQVFARGAVRFNDIGDNKAVVSVSLGLVF